MEGATPLGWGVELRCTIKMRVFVFQENRFLISVYYIIMLLTSYIMVIWATILNDQSDKSGHNDGSEQVAIVVYVSTLAMVINLVVVYLFAVCLGQKKQGYVSV